MKGSEVKERDVKGSVVKERDVKGSEGEGREGGKGKEMHMKVINQF